MPVFQPALDILPAAQRSLWADLSCVPRDFVLYGGTALALRLAHRISEDFDFFSLQPFAPDDLERRMALLRGAERLQSAPNTLVSRVEHDAGAVKLAFFGGLHLRRVEDPEPAVGNGVHVAALLDLAATKVKAVQDRAEAKDYLDVDRLLSAGVDLSRALGAARAVYGDSFNPLLSAKALCYFADGNLESLPAAVQARLTAAASQIDVARLPRVPPLPGGLLP
jgi:hypothetical protein